MEAAEIRDPGRIQGDYFPIEISRSGAQVAQLIRDRPKPTSPVEAGPRQQRYLAASDPRRGAITVKLDLVEPSIAFGRSVYQFR